ncbi:MAG: sulfatase [Planctomycetota bacterium]|nr:hypothetical protein [Planctomycetota bacterium]MDP6520821.1 sulfatase [Planctomycetota bacterium]MDP6838566.1 sulfatase [Planctomycetota bacterium]
MGTRERSKWLAALPALALAWACGGDEVEPQGLPAVGALPQAADIVLITIDTLRADHLGCYGYHRDTSPRLDALAAEGIICERAMATMATTLPSHLSLFTGLYPHQHGHLSNKRAVMGPFEPGPGRELATTLLEEAGWRTAAFISAGPLKRSTGMQIGFEVWDQPAEIWRTGEETVDLALAWLDKDLTDEPTFLWIHLWDPHEPNTPPAEYLELFPTDEQTKALVRQRRMDHALLQRTFDDKELARVFFPDLMEPLQRGEELELPELTEEHMLDLINRYDADVRYTDDCLGRIFDALQARGRWDQSFVVVAGDHGQGLGQHDWLLHGRLSGENLHVPLVMKLPRDIAPPHLAVERVVSLVDVFPTVLSRMKESATGRLTAQASGDDMLSGAFRRSWAFSQRTAGQRGWEQDQQAALTTRPWRYYLVEDGPDMLFDLTLDAGELKDVAAGNPDVVEQLADLTRRVMSQGVHAGSEEDGGSGGLSEEAQQHLQDLRDLGYVGDD